MNAPNNSPEYLLLFRNTAWHRELPPTEVERVMTDWMAWFDGLIADGRCRGGQSLNAEVRVVSGEAKTVTDGPFAEAKETVAGYFILTVPDFDEAVAIAQNCPGLPYGIIVEVRELRERCAAAQYASDAQAALASA